MTITTSAIGFTFCSFGLAFCGIRFFRAFQKIGDSRAGRRIGILLSLLYLGFALVTGILGIGALFFAKNPEVLYASLLIAHSFLTVTTVMGVYLIFYTLYPLVSPMPGMIFAFLLGLAEVTTLIRDSPRPMLDAVGGIDWGFSRLLSILLAYLLFIGIGSFFVVFTHSFLQAKSREVRFISFIMATLSILAILSAFIWLVLPRDVIFPAFIQSRIFDITLAFIGIVLIGVFVMPPRIIGWFLGLRGFRSRFSPIFLSKFLLTFERRILPV